VDIDDKYDELKRICCGETKFKCLDFLNNLTTNQRATYDSSTAALQMVAELKQSLSYALDFTRPEVISPSAFKGMKTTDAGKRADDLNVRLHIQDQPFSEPILEPLQVFRSNTLSGTERDIYAYQTGGQIVDVRAEWREPALIDPADRAKLDEDIARAQAQADAAMKEVEILKKHLTETQGFMKRYAEFRQNVDEAAKEGPAASKRRSRPRRSGKQEGGENG
jgi:hypothetical protein